MRSTPTIIGACGEHYVASYLSGHNLIVAMPRAGIPGCDLFVAREKGGNAIRVQVKTGTEGPRNNKEVGSKISLWHTSKAAIERDDKYLWYAYVWLNDWPKEEDKLPEVFFVPSRAVVNCIKQCLADKDTWLYFWMRVADAQKYKGSAGLKALLGALG